MSVMSCVIAESLMGDRRGCYQSRRPPAFVTVDVPSRKDGAPCVPLHDSLR